jgi:hypothetical protein
MDLSYFASGNNNISEFLHRRNNFVVGSPEPVMGDLDEVQTWDVGDEHLGRRPCSSMAGPP